MSQIPKGVRFKNVRPKGVYQEYREYVVTPIQTYSNQFNQNDIVRIQFNLKDWYIDPYESYIEAEVRLPPAQEASFPVNTNKNSINYVGQSPSFYMMDGPSTSLINDYRLECNSREIERIREYDQLGNLLTDLNMYPDVVDQKDFEGYYTIQGKQTIQRQQNCSTNFTSVMSQTTGGYYQKTLQFNNPFQNAQNVLATNCDGTLSSTANYGVGTSIVADRAATGLNVGCILQALQAENGAQINGTTAYVPPGTGLLKTKDFLQQVFQGTLQSGTASGYNGQMYGDSTILGNLTANNSNFGIFANNNISTEFINPCQISPKLDQIDGHNIFLTNLPVSKIQLGQFHNNPPNFFDSTINQAQLQTRAYMQIPLLSGVMGVLIPQDRWQLIPSSSLGQVNMEFRFNPNAFFSHDGSQPNWIVSKFQLKLKLYRFDQTLQQQLQQTVSSGIQMHSQIFSMGPIYNIQAGVSVQNNWQLNNGIPSIKQLFFWFLSNDFENYNQARKNFKVSQNITSMQLKIGSNYIPQQPITGRSGDIVMNTVNLDDNSVFLSELQQSLNILFDCKKHININKLNFAINNRPYDVTCQTAFGVNLAASFPIALNQAKNYGYYLWEEMRCRGKAVYMFNLEMAKGDDETMTGMDTTKVRPIELILKSENGNNYQNQSTMYVMFLSDFIVTFNGDETKTEGAG